VRSWWGRLLLYHISASFDLKHSAVVSNIFAFHIEEIDVVTIRFNIENLLQYFRHLLGNFCHISASFDLKHSAVVSNIFPFHIEEIDVVTIRFNIENLLQYFRQLLGNFCVVFLVDLSETNQITQRTRIYCTSPCYVQTR